MIQSPPPPEKAATDDEDTSEERPPWQWVGFGTIATFASWLPLAYLAEAVRHHVFLSRFGSAPSEDEVKLAFAAMSAMERFRWTAMQTLPHVIAFALSAFAGGLLVGRFGAGTGPREAAFSGVVTASIALAVSWRVLAEGGWGAVVSVVVPLAIAVFFSWWGGRVGARKRAKKAA
ncbi:MAG: tRNA-(ms[2]io[6]A)-hydroxylase [Myxococcaceae bacterium]|nr:tRNA-(ms[2]io[6]A)-hydroxylase [Myxococcaceae bacterium]MEA2745922.1 tRNA 2-(methylsulfanyl)-N6-isopentenyladenosine37 hydroxylase [Myxococcales bacterium]